MRLTVGAVLDQVVAEGLAAPRSIERAREVLEALEGAVDTTPPWYARVIAGFGAWMATAFLIGFLVVSDVVGNAADAMKLGPILVAAAVLLRRSAKLDAEFTRQLALAVSFAGQALLIVGVGTETKSWSTAARVTLVMSVALIPLVPDQAHRFMSALIGSLAAFWAMGDLTHVGRLGRLVVGGPDVAALAMVAVIAYVWRADLRGRSPDLAEMLRPVGYGTVVGLFGLLLFSSLFAAAAMNLFATARPGPRQFGPATAVGITAALVALQVAISKEQRPRPHAEALVVAILASLVLCWLTLWTPGVVAAVAALALGFDRRDRVLVGLAIAFLVKFASVYYYSLQMTLLAKSMVLVAGGLVLLAARGYLRLRFGSTEATA